MISLQFIIFKHLDITKKNPVFNVDYDDAPGSLTDQNSASSPKKNSGNADTHVPIHNNPNIRNQSVDTMLHKEKDPLGHLKSRPR